MKVNDEIATLHFESVRAALSGVEAVLKEFPPAGSFLKEFGLLNEALMTTERGIINFNPEYFTDERKFTATIDAGVRVGYYPKNMTAAGVGAHEMGHIVEDWLIKKHKETSDVRLRILPRKLIRAAYQRAIATPEGKGKSIEQLKTEIAVHASEENASECLSDAVCDYFTNATKAALLSRILWGILKEDLVKVKAFGEMKLSKFAKEEVLAYGIFDEWGDLSGVKDDAPADFKEAYEHDKKTEEELAALGID